MIFTTFDDLLALGDTVILFRDIFAHQTVTQAYNAFSKNGFGAGLAILNKINDPAVREEKLKLLSQNALFNFDSFVETGQIMITRDNDLVRQIITASNSEEMLSLIAHQNISEANKELVDQKLATIQKSGFSKPLVVGLMLVAAMLLLAMLFQKKIPRKQHALKKTMVKIFFVVESKPRGTALLQKPVLDKKPSPAGTALHDK